MSITDTNPNIRIRRYAGQVLTRRMEIAESVGRTRYIDRAQHRAMAGQDPRHASPARHRQHGYTLIEVIVAFAILALGLTLLLGTLTGATRQVRWADEAGRAALHAQSLLDSTGVGVALQPGQTSGTFEDGHYHWSMVVTPYSDPLLPPVQSRDLGAPRLLQLSLTVQWGDDDDARRRLQVQSLRLVTPNPLGTGGSR